jgi:parallel beta-helix repeat protein
VRISGKTNQTILEDKEIEEPVKISDCENCTIVNCDFSNNDSGIDMFVLDNCKGCKVIKSKFHGKSTVGCAVKVDGEKNKG